MSDGYPLYHAETADAWHHRTSPELSDCARQGSIGLLPVYTFRRHEPDWPLDAEEWIGGQVLKQALASSHSQIAPPFLVLPPLRHCPAQEVGQCFTVDLATGSRLLEEVLRSVSLSGFTRVVLLHVHPLLADWLDCVLRDVRLQTGLDLYRIGMDGIGVDVRDAFARRQLACCFGDGEYTSLVETAGTRLHALLGQIERHRFPNLGGAL